MAAFVLAWPGALVIGISLGLFGSGGSVLTDAFSIARRLGANPIILAGVDLLALVRVEA